MHLFALLPFILLCAEFATAQHHLVIGKTGRPYKYIYQEGDQLRFRLKGEKSWSQGLILGLSYDGIRMHYFTLQPDEIGAIDIRDQRRGRFLEQTGSALAVAGPSFFLIDQFNRTVIRNEPGADKKSALIGGASMLFS